MILDLENELKICTEADKVSIQIKKQKYFEQMLFQSQKIKANLEIDYQTNTIRYQNKEDTDKLDSIILSSYSNWVALRKDDFSTLDDFNQWLSKVEGYYAVEYYLQDCVLNSLEYLAENNPTLFIENVENILNNKYTDLADLESDLLDKFILGKYINILLNLKGEVISVNQCKNSIENILSTESFGISPLYKYLNKIASININSKSNSEVFNLYLKKDKTLLKNYMETNLEGNMFYNIVDFFNKAMLKLKPEYINKMYILSLELMKTK